MKFLYLAMSKARTVPSSELDTTTLPLGVKARPVTAASCSAKVTKQKLELVFHSLTLASVPPVATSAPSGE